MKKSPGHKGNHNYYPQNINTAVLAQLFRLSINLPNLQSPAIQSHPLALFVERFDSFRAIFSRASFLLPLLIVNRFTHIGCRDHFDACIALVRH